MGKAIYEYICENITDGRLPESFSLPREDTGREIKFACGALDGIMMYHFGGQPEDNADDICAAVYDWNDGGVRAVEKTLGNKSALFLCDPLQQRILEDKKLAPNDVHKIALQLIKCSARAEGVKIGLSLLELLDTEDDGEVRDILRTLGACDEFTLWCCYILRHYDDGNEEIFRLAQRTQGWGKVFAIREFLEADTPEKRCWLLRFGCKNNVLNGYLGEPVYIKAEVGKELSERLPESFDEEEVRGLAVLALGLTDEEPMPGASALEKPLEALQGLRRVLALHSGEELIDRAIAEIDCYELSESEE